MSKTFLPDSKSMRFLAGMTEAAIEASRVRPGDKVEAGLPANSLDYTLIRPGGRACYPAVWTQDYALTLATGFVTPEEMWNHLRLIAEAQNGSKERKLKSGAIIPPFAVPDHVLFNGKAVYFPGTYSSGSDQGGEPWGIVPPTNNQYDFVLIAFWLWQATGQTDFLRRHVGGISVIERLRKAFMVPHIEKETGMVYTDAKRRAVGFIFCDSIYMTGHLLFASLLRWRTAHHLAQLEEALGNSRKALLWRAAVALIPRNLASTFDDPERIGGWLMAATGIGRQPDVWGTIYALYLGLLDRKTAQAARREIVKALEEGTICHEGAVRHVPTNRDASLTSAWERTPTPYNTYQNGAYWHTPTGWLIAVLSKESPKWAMRIFKSMIAHLKREDFRKGGTYSAPWECFGKESTAQNNPVFLGSVVLPYGVLKKLAKSRKK
jgi:hypothetical protein